MKIKFIMLLFLCLVFQPTCCVVLDQKTNTMEQSSFENIDEPVAVQAKLYKTISISATEEIENIQKIEELIKTNIALFPYYSEFINIIKHPENENILLIRFASLWFYDIYIAEISDNSKLDLMLLGKCADSARFIKLHGFNEYFVEMYSSSNMGNGGLNLYNLNDKSFYYIDKVFDCNHETMKYRDLAQYFGTGYISFIYKNGYLEVSYDTIDNNGFSELTFTGTQQIMREYEYDDILYEDKCKLVYEYDFDSDTFMLNKMKCIFPEYWFYNWNAIGE